MKLLLTACICLLLACREPASQNASRTSDTLVTLVAKTPAIPDTTTLAGGWFLQPALPSDVATGKAASIRFDLAKTHFSGNTGCNNMNGEFWYSGNDSSLSFSDKIATTKMLCAGYNEKAFLQSLMHTTHYRLSSGLLILLAENNTELSRWARTPSTQTKSGKV